MHLFHPSLHYLLQRNTDTLISSVEIPSRPHHKQHHPSSTSTSTAAAPITTSYQESPEQFEATHDPNNPDDQDTNEYLFDGQQGDSGGNGKA